MVWVGVYNCVLILNDMYITMRWCCTYSSGADVNMDVGVCIGSSVDMTMRIGMVMC